MPQSCSTCKNCLASTPAEGQYPCEVAALSLNEAFTAVDESVLQADVAIVTRLTRVPSREVVITERWPSVSVVSPKVVLDFSGYLASVSASSLSGIPLWSDRCGLFVNGRGGWRWPILQQGSYFFHKRRW